LSLGSWQQCLGLAREDMAGAFMICQQMHAGYTMEEVVGRNPRFMQDPQSDPGAVAKMGQAIREGRATVVEIINQRKDGSRFWNQVSTHAQYFCTSSAPTCILDVIR
jgi:hypothetical protein